MPISFRPMDFVILISKLLGIYILIAFLVLAFRKDSVQAAFADIDSMPGLLRVMGVLEIAFAIFILINVYGEFGWVLLSFTSLLLILEGSLYTFAPVPFVQHLLKNWFSSNLYYPSVFVILVLGFSLIGLGFGLAG